MKGRDYSQILKSKDFQEVLKYYTKFLPGNQYIYRSTIENKNTTMFQIEMSLKAKIHLNLVRASFVNAKSVDCNLLCEMASAYENVRNYQEAITFYKAAQELKSKSHQDFLTNKLYELRDYDEKFLYERIDAADKQNTNASLETVVYCYTQLLKLKPNDYTSLNNRAAALNRLGRFVPAKHSASRAVAIDETLHFAWRHLGDAHFGLQKYDQAELNYLKAVELNPKYEEAWLRLGDIFTKNGKFDEAIHAYQRLLAIPAHFALATQGIKALIFQTKSINFYKMLIDAITLDLPANVTLALAYGDKSIMRIKDDCGKTPTALAAKLGRKTCLGILLEMDGTLVKCCDSSNQTPLHYAAFHGRKDCVKLLLKYGANVNSLTTENLTPIHNAILGYLSPLNSSSEDALACIYSLLKNGGDLYRINLQHQTSRQMAEDGGSKWSSVVEYIDKIIAKDVEHIMQCADQLVDDRCYTSAIAKYEYALTLMPNNSVIWNDKAYVHNQLKQFEKAKDCAKTAIDLDNRYPNPWRHLGNAYVGLQQYRDAMGCFRNAFRLRPNYPEVEKDKQVCLNYMSEIELVALIRSRVREYIRDLKNKIDNSTFFGHTFFYDKSLCDQKLVQAENLNIALSTVKSKAKALELLNMYLTFDHELAASFQKSTESFTDLLKKIVANIDELKATATLNVTYDEGSDRSLAWRY